MGSLRAVLAIAAKDIVTWLRTPSAIAVSLLPPIAFLLIIFVVAGTSWGERLSNSPVTRSRCGPGMARFR